MSEDGGTNPTGLVPRRVRPLDGVLIAGGVVLFLVLLYTMRGLLNPLLVGAAGLIMLWPVRSHGGVRAIMLSGLFLLVIWFFDRISTILLPFGFAYLLAFLFNPAVKVFHERFRVPRWASSLLVTGLIIGAITAVFLLLVPSLAGQLEVLGERILGGVSGLRGWLTGLALLDSLENAGLIQKTEFVAEIVASVQEQATTLARGIPETAQQIVKSLGSLLGIITVLAILPVLLFYNVKDFDVITDRVSELFPTFGGRREYLLKAGSVVGRYLRGQLTISAIAAFNVSVALLLFDVPFALLIGLLGGLLNMIPNVGAIVTNVIGVTIAVVFGDPWFAKATIVFLVLLGESLLESSVLTPHILGHQVGLHPVLILLSLFVFGSFLGLLGLFIAVPVTALIVATYSAWKEQINLEITSFVAPVYEND